MTIARSFEISYSSLRLFRISLGLTSCYAAIEVLRFSSYFFGEEGILPAKMTGDLPSLYNVLPSTLLWHQILLTLIAFLSCAFAFGKPFTNLIAFFLWLLWVSTYNRLSHVANGGWLLLCIMFLWSIFIPFQKQTLKSTKDQNYKNLRSTPVLGLGLLLVSVFVVSGVLKSQTLTWAKYYSAVGLTLQHSLSSSFARTIYLAVADHPVIMKTLTIYVLAVEIFCPFLIVLSKNDSLVRKVSFLLLVILPIMFFLSFELSAFPFATLTLILPWCPAFKRDLSSKPEMDICLPPLVNANKWKESLMIVILVLQLSGNILPFAPGAKIVKEANNRFYKPLRLTQKWNMFAFDNWKRQWFWIEAEDFNHRPVLLWGKWLTTQDTLDEVLSASFSEPLWEHYFWYGYTKIISRKPERVKFLVKKLMDGKNLCNPKVWTASIFFDQKSTFPIGHSRHIFWQPRSKTEFQCKVSTL